MSVPPSTPPPTSAPPPSAPPTGVPGQERGGPAHSPRSGAHRPRRPLWHDIAPTLVVLVAVLALVVGVVLLKDSVLGSSATSSSGPSAPGDDDQQSPAPTAPTPTGTPSGSPSSSASSTAGSAPTVNKNVRVHVWNGTSRSGLAAGAASKLTGKGWHASSAGNRQGYGGATTVYYTKASLRVTAKAVAKALGGYPVKQSTAYGSTGVVVVLGSDYQA